MAQRFKMPPPYHWRGQRFPVQNPAGSKDNLRLKPLPDTFGQNFKLNLSHHLHMNLLPTGDVDRLHL